MVTIINGEIVPDSDPRAKAYRERRNNSSPGQSSTRAVYQNYNRDNQGIQDGGQNNDNSPFTEINNYLRRLGIPQFTLAGRVIEPVVLIGALLVVLFFGLPGLLLMGVIYFVLSSGMGNSGVNQRQRVM